MEQEAVSKIKESLKYLRRWNKSARHAKYLRNDSEYATLELYIIGATECRLALKKKRLASLVQTNPETNPLDTYTRVDKPLTEVIDDLGFHESARRLLDRQRSDKFLRVYLGLPDKIPKLLTSLDNILEKQYYNLSRCGYLHEGDGNFDVH